METLQDFLVHKDCTGSTNDDLKAMVQAGLARPGTVVMAERQEAGRGRKGAEWFCDEGKGLAFSVALAPTWEKSRWGWMSLAAGLAVSQALEGLGFTPAIKWPNDLLLADRKCCGILVEALGDLVVVGVGVNVNGTVFPGDFAATSLESEGGVPISREKVLQGIWVRMQAVIEQSPEELSGEIWKRLAWCDREVETSIDGRIRTGRIAAFGPSGELVIQSDGELLKILEAGSVRSVQG